jgi:signal transduction histidine kinase
VTLEVQDDGVGLPSLAEGGHGLRNMQQRVADLGGTLTIDGAAGRGTTVRAVLPTDRV